MQSDNAELHKTIEALTSKHVYKETNDTALTQLNNISCVTKDLKEKFHTLEISHDKLASELTKTQNHVIQHNTQLEILKNKCERDKTLTE